MSAWKEHGLRRVADEVAAVVVDVVPRPPAQVLTFVPPDRERLLKRGHHPPERLARALAPRWSLPLEQLLVRPRPAQPQRGLALPERRRNVAGAFDAETAPRDVILVDGVYTTGATAGAAASALRRAGARRVHVVTFARAVR